MAIGKGPDLRGYVGKEELAAVLAPVVKRPARGIMPTTSPNGARARDEAGIRAAQDSSAAD